jgi:hypothetical protein
VTTEPEALPPDVPIFGRNPDPVDERKTRTFALEVEVQMPATRGRAPHVERTVEQFLTYTDLDAGAVLGLMNARNRDEQAQRTAVVLGTTLVDLDGAPVQWVPPIEPEYDDEGNVLRTDASDARGEGEPLYLFWNGDLVTADELRLDEVVEGSSRRRFSVLMNDPYRRVRIEALNEIAEWLVADVAGRPTTRPTPSPRGPQRTRAGRVAR